MSILLERVTQQRPREVSFEEDSLSLAIKFLRASAGSAERGLDYTFNKHADQWRIDTAFSSSLTETIMHPAYQRIIGMGKPVVPIILRSLMKKQEPWFWALESITGEHVSGDNFTDTVNAWISWGKSKGLI